MKALFVMLTLLAAGFPAPPLLAQWGPRGCAPAGPVGPPAFVFAPAPAVRAAPVASPAEGWHPHPDRAGQHALYRGGRYVGLFDSATGDYWPWDGRAYGDACAPPVAPPAGATAARKAAACACDVCVCCDACPGGRPQKVAQVQQDFGCRWEPGGEEVYRINGRKVTRTEAIQALEAGSLTDDSARLRLTVIGTEEECRRVAGDLAADPQLKAAAGDVLVQCYRPDDWAVRDAGFRRDGKPTIYVQRPDGKVLHRQDEYRGPAKLAEALRRARPDYDPAKDPDLNRAAPQPPAPGPAPLLGLASVPPGLWLVGGLALLALFAPAIRRMTANAER